MPDPACPPPTPPYHAFKRALRTFKEHGVPAVIDASALRKSFPAALCSQLLDTFMFLDLVQSSGEPTAHFAPLVASIDGEEWAPALRARLKQAYGTDLLESLDNTTPAHLNERLTHSYGVDGAGRRRVVTFLIAAAHDARVPLSPYLLTPTGAKGRLQSPGNASEARGLDAEDPSTSEKLAAKLIDKLPAFDPKWPDTLKEHWFFQFSELVHLLKSEERQS